MSVCASVRSLTVAVPYEAIGPSGLRPNRDRQEADRRV
jgi:hypothetical protein